MRPHPFNATLPAPDEICAAGALELSAHIGAGRLCCREVMRAYLARIAEVNPTVNAIVALRDEADLLAEADRADRELAAGRSRGWLHGLPTAPKDLAATAWLVTTLGSPIFRDHVPVEDALVVARARAAGAIVIGKTNTPEFGLGSQTYNTVYGVTRNAFDTALCAGGSSGGAAVAVALHLLPVADGSDMMGSLRNPAAFNGVYGLRPSAGRVPAVPDHDQFVSQLATEGPIGRSPRDCARLLATQAGSDPRAPLSLPGDGSEFVALGEHRGDGSAPLAGTRVAWLGDLDGHLPMQPGVLERCERAATRLAALGAEVEPGALGYPPEALWRTWLTLRQGIVGARLGPYYRDPALRPLLKPEALWEVEHALGASAADFVAASAERTRWYHAALALFERFDFLLMPSAQVFPFDVDVHWPREIAGRPMDTYHRWMETVLPATMAGLPAINLPLLPSRTDGAARDMAGVQLIGAPRADAAVLRAAIAWADADEATVPRTLS